MSCCCGSNDRILTSEVFYDGILLSPLNIVPDDNMNVILTKINNYLSTFSGVNIIPGAGISVSKSGSTFTITNTAPNINQTISLSGNTVTLSNGGGSFVLPAATPQVNADWNAVSGVAMILNKPTIPANQTLSWDGGTTTLSISNGNSVVIPVGGTYTAGTGISISGNTITNTAPNVTQTLSLSGMVISLSGGGGSVTIPAYPVYDGSETKLSASTGISISGSGTIASPYVIANTSPNVNQTISISGSVITLSGGGGSVTVPTPAPQTLSISGSNLSISGGNTVVLPSGGATELTANSFNYGTYISTSYKGWDTKGGFATRPGTFYTAATAFDFNSVTDGDKIHILICSNMSFSSITLPSPVTYQGRILEFKIAAENPVSFSPSIHTFAGSQSSVTVSGGNWYLKLQAINADVWEIIDIHRNIL